MPRTRRAPVMEPTDSDEIPEVDESTPEGQSALRSWAIRTKKRCRHLESQLTELPRLQLENAMFRAGLDPENPAHQLVMATFEGEPDPERLRAHWIDVQARVLHAQIVSPPHTNGSTPPSPPSSSTRLDERDDGPSPAELDHQRASVALHRRGETPDA